MSCITSLILTCACTDSGANAINDFNPSHDCIFDMVSCDDDKLPRGWYGGVKMLTADVYVGAINYLPSVEEFINYLRTIEWEVPECVQLFILEEDDIRFRVENLFP